MTRPCSSSSSLWLRIIQINDVYQLDSFPSLKTLIREKSTCTSGPPNAVLVVVTGDFLAPYLLSSLDHGRGMVDCLNALGVTHVCFGNHETDVSPQALAQRILQSQFLWINTNMQDIQDKLNQNQRRRSSCSSIAEGKEVQEPVVTPTHDIITVSSKDGTYTLKVGLLGLLTNDASLYRPGSFAGATIEPIISCTEAFLLQQQQQQNDDVDFWIPMTHQSIKDDREFANHFGGETFPIVLGGHDHEIFDETHRGGCRVVKAGQDAIHAAIIDVTWEFEKNSEAATATSRRTIDVSVESVLDYAPDPAMLKRVRDHTAVLRELERASLFRVSDWGTQQHHEDNDETTSPNSSQLLRHHPQSFSFSTIDNRILPSTGTTALCTMLRMGMRCHCAILNAGSVRGNRSYDHSHQFTWSNLKEEVPFSTDLTLCHVPGHVLEACIRHSRADSRKQPALASGGYLHTCDNIHYDNNRDCIVSIQNQPFCPNQLYLVALPLQFFQGIDNHQPLLDWAAEIELKIDPGSAYPAKLLIVQLFSSLLWLQLGSFDDIDYNHDGVLTRDEVRQRVMSIYGNSEEVSDLVLDGIFSVADLNGNGTISPLEMMIVEFAATDVIGHESDVRRESRTLRQIAAHVLGKKENDGDKGSDDMIDNLLYNDKDVEQMVQQIRHTLDLNRDGKISRDDVMKVIGELRSRKDLLN